MSIQEKLKHELKAVVMVTLFFAAWLGILMMLKALILEDYHIRFNGLAMVLISVLVLVKVVLLLEKAFESRHEQCGFGPALMTANTGTCLTSGRIPFAWAVPCFSITFSRCSTATPKSVDWLVCSSHLRSMLAMINASCPGRRRAWERCVPTVALSALALPCLAQDIEPRRWSHLPLGSNFGGVAYAYTEGDISFNPVLRIKDGEFDLNTAAFKYIHAFELLGKSARIDLAQNYQSGSWSGLLNGVSTAIERDGWADSTLRFAVNLYGAPPLSGQEFIEYRKAAHYETIIGMGLVMTFPTGEYFEDKLINLGSNRFSFTPQFGVVHTRGKWSMELSSSVSFYTDNDEFFNGAKQEEDSYLVGQGHLIYTFMPGLWLGASGGYGYGGESTINQVSADDLKGNLGFGLSAGISVTRNFGFKIAYIGIRTREDTGSDNDTLTIACSLQW